MKITDAIAAAKTDGERAIGAILSVIGGCSDEAREIIEQDFEQKDMGLDKSYILLLRDREAPKAPLYTVEWNAKENRVIQCRGRGNRPLQPETEERKNQFLEAWVARNERLRTEGKLKDVI